MSKERELLKRWFSEFGKIHADIKLLRDTQALLTQPEQQPEAWIIVNKETGYRTQVSDLTPFLYHREIFEVIPLYTAPPKREPLSDEDVFRLYEESEYLGFLAYRKGIKDAEKAHGIGGGE